MGAGAVEYAMWVHFQRASKEGIANAGRGHSMTKTPGVGAKAIDDLLASDLPPHLKLLFEAVRYCGVALLLIHHESGPFSAERPSADVPMMILIGDADGIARGPTAFDARSLQLALKSVRAVVVISSGPTELGAYASAALVATWGRSNVLIIETTIEQEVPWAMLVEKLAPTLPRFICSPRGGQ